MKPGMRQKDLIQGRYWAIYKPDIRRISLLRRVRDSLSQASKNVSGENLQTGRKGHSLKIITHEGRKYFLKYFVSNRTSWNRRLELLVKEMLQGGARKCFLGALFLKEAGIPTAEPVGFCSIGLTPWSKKGVFVCEYLENQGSIQDCLSVSDSAFLRSELLFKMARIARKVHNHGLRHTDIVEHNFLVQTNVQGMPEVFLIDTDKVHFAGFSRFIPLLKQYLDLRCLMRLKYSDAELEWFLQQYFGFDYHSTWLKVLLFLRNGGFSLRRRFKIAKKKRAKDV